MGWTKGRARSRTLGVVVVLALAGLTAFAPSAAGAKAATLSVRTSAAVVPPAGLVGSSLDCNGYSMLYPNNRPGSKALCTDPFEPSTDGGPGYRYIDNGHYIGHDEPSVKFISSASGSGNTMTYYMTLSKDPSAPAKPDGSVSDYGMLSIAPWFGLPMCDDNSYPNDGTTCAPDSDTNSGADTPAAAPSAFMELQFYPPKFGPFLDGVSCSPTHWCTALTIDSLECTFGFSFCNGNCEEPQNFAYLTKSGTPSEAPDPNASKTYNTTADTLMLNDGDSLRVIIEDTPAGLKTEVDDLTTGQSGSMVASASNDFANTNLATCATMPYSFHAEYDTAKIQNQVPWAALEGGVLMQQEIGHFEGCDSVKNVLGFPPDPEVAQTCVGGTERGGGEGPCTFDKSGNETCANATTEGHPDCTADEAAVGLCEFSDAACMPAGSRPTPASAPSGLPTWNWPIAACLDTFFQNGDLDFDGNSYLHDWPDGTKNHPTAFQYTGPFDKIGDPYPTVQFETDVAASESQCDTETGKDCTAQPKGASFYPFWTIGPQSSNGGSVLCQWNFGAHIAAVTSDDLHNVQQYGNPDVARFAGTVISQPQANPQLSSSCKAH